MISSKSQESDRMTNNRSSLICSVHVGIRHMTFFCSLTSIVGNPVGELEGTCVGDTTFSTQNEPSAQTTLVDVFLISCRVALSYV